MSIWMIIGIGIAIFILYYLYTLTKNISLVKGVTSLNTSQNVLAKTFDEMADKVYYDGWLFITNAPTNTSGTPTKNIILQREFMIGMENTSFKVYKITNANTYTEVATATSNFPLNKWVYFAVNYSNNILEIYLNGKLLKTVYIKNETDLINSGYKKYRNLDVGNTANNIKGYITKLRRLTTPPEANYIWQHYLEGNGQMPVLFGGIFRDTYGIKVNVYNDSQKIRDTKLL